MYNNNNNNNNNRNQNGNIGALYKLVSKDGKTYLKGKINGEDVVIYANTFKKEAKHPDYIVLKAYNTTNNNGNNNKSYGNNYGSNNRGKNYNNYQNSGNNYGYTKQGQSYTGGNVDNIIKEENDLNGIDF